MNKAKSKSGVGLEAERPNRVAAITFTLVAYWNQVEGRKQSAVTSHSDQRSDRIQNVPELMPERLVDADTCDVTDLFHLPLKLISKAQLWSASYPCSLAPVLPPDAILVSHCSSSLHLYCQ